MHSKQSESNPCALEMRKCAHSKKKRMKMGSATYFQSLFTRERQGDSTCKVAEPYQQAMATERTYSECFTWDIKY